ncbi:MAG: cytochrome c-type biogenesis protein CcmH [Thiogranum sp.]|nr:cytochrome c-type biogenesis protein CcmH [Thiogranum sp.]
MNLWRSLLIAIAIGSVTPAWAGLEAFDFSGNVNEDRYKELIAEVRCLVCQNQSLADSDAGLAHDLRMEVYKLMEQGQSDEQIIDFLVSRYGDFVLYQPPVKPSTYLLWYGPFVLLALGLLLLLRTLRQRRAQIQSEPGLSPEEQQRVERLLNESDSGKEERQ